jgi:hypothetical protein
MLSCVMFILDSLSVVILIYIMPRRLMLTTISPSVSIMEVVILIFLNT